MIYDDDLLAATHARSTESKYDNVKVDYLYAKYTIFQVHLYDMSMKIDIVSVCVYICIVDVVIYSNIYFYTFQLFIDVFL